MTVICASIPLLGYVLRKLFLLLSSPHLDNGADSDDEVMVNDKQNDLGTACNAAAQKHFRQLQHIRGA
ncbi:unnamed protein product [Ilex paraguariensis]|uniref:Uncharacterized protein n=1 Tax=Ilex paraguariensis TaxID=185542 RepID=A0ABC8SFS4_9AQUA